MNTSQTFLLQSDVTLAELDHSETRQSSIASNVANSPVGMSKSVQSSRFIDALKKGSEIQLIVKGRVTGKESSRPVWFVLMDHDILLLPVTGVKTQWYRNTIKNPQVRITISGESFTGFAHPIKDSRGISEVVDLFRAKYGAGDVKKYYPRIDVASKVSLV